MLGRRLLNELLNCFTLFLQKDPPEREAALNEYRAALSAGAELPEAKAAADASASTTDTYANFIDTSTPITCS